MAVLYVVATPIGNMEDISMRALRVLGEVDLIAAEDTRHTGKLLSAHAIKTPVIAYHDHNERESADGIVDRIRAGESVALVSDAGTPLLSDPGYRLVSAAVAAGVQIVPVPGPSAITTALSAAGLPTDRFCFEGFLPAKSAQRRSALTALQREPRTMVFYEAPHRIKSLCTDVADVLGCERQVSLARELTKRFEQIWTGDAGAAVEALAAGDVPEKGEFVVLVAGAERGQGEPGDESIRVMTLLLKELAPGKAAALASEILGQPRKALYDIALQMKKE